MTAADKRVEELLDRWMASLELHARYLKLDDAAYARAENVAAAPATDEVDHRRRATAAAPSCDRTWRDARMPAIRPSPRRSS